MAPARRIAQRPAARTLQVLRTLQVSPSMRRITLGGAELAGFEHTGPNVKVFVPREGQERPVLPALDDDTGRYVWPAPDERPTMRTYTVRRYDKERGELAVDFVLHGGVASSWAARALPGDFLGVLGPGGKHCRAADWYLFVGDETALPAISALLESLPTSTRGRAFIEVADVGEQQELAGPPGLEVAWLHRNGVPAGRSDLLDRVVREIELPYDADISTWVSGESTMVRSIRRHLREERGLDSGSVLATGYWKCGLAETEYHERYNHDREDPLARKP